MDREKVINGLNCCCHTDGSNCSKCPYDIADSDCTALLSMDVLALLKEQENRWVSVKDRMPDEAGKYYVSGGGKVWFGEMMCLGGMKGWINSAKNPNVEAWMPPPEAYKKGGEVG